MYSISTSNVFNGDIVPFSIIPNFIISEEMANNILRSAIRGTSDTFYDNYMYNQTVNNRVNDDDDDNDNVWGLINKIKQTFNAIRIKLEILRYLGNV